MGSPNLPSAVLESNRGKQLVCGKLLQYVAKEEQVFFHLQVQLCAHQSGAAQGCSLLTCAVFVQLRPIAGKHGFLELCLCLLSRLPSLCRAAACDAISRSSAAEESGESTAVPSPNGTSKVRGTGRKPEKNTGAQAAGHETDWFAFHAAQLFLYPACLPLLPSPPQSSSLPCQEHIWYKGLKSQDHFHSVGTKDFLCCNSSVQLCKRPSRRAQQHVPW